MGPRVGLEGVAQGPLGPSGDPEAQEGDGLTELSRCMQREGAQHRLSCSPPTRPHGGHGLPVTATVDHPFPASQPGGWVFSPLPGVLTDSCLRQDPDFRAWSRKLPITPLQSSAKRLPGRHDGRGLVAGLDGRTEGRPAPSQRHSDVWEDRGGQSGRRQRPPHCVRQGGTGRWRE